MEDMFMYVLGILLGCVGFYIKGLKSDLTKNQDDLQDLRNSLPREFVYRDDFLRVVANLDTKVDRLTVDISHMSENIAKLVAGGEKN